MISFCFNCNFLSSFVYPGLFMSNSACVSRKAVESYPTGASGPCSQFLVKSESLIYFCYFVCIILVTLCSLLWLSVFSVWSFSMDYILLISAIILVPLITLPSQLSTGNQISMETGKVLILIMKIFWNIRQ